MQEDMQRLIEYKNELEVLIEEQNKEIDEKNEKGDEILQALKDKEEEGQQWGLYLEDLEKQLKDSMSKSKTYESRIRKLKSGKITELTKKIKDK